MNKEKLEVIKVGSLVVIAISLAVIAWKMEGMLEYLYQITNRLWRNTLKLTGVLLQEEVKPFACWTYGAG